MKETNWLSSAKENLFKLSSNMDNFEIARKEWIYVGMTDNGNADFDCQLCSHPEIRYEYLIKNSITNNELIVGSSCILKFVEYLTKNHEKLLDEEGIEINNKRLIDDKIEYWKKILFEALEQNFNNGDFEKSITSKIKEDGELTANQAKYLNKFYYNLDDMEQLACRRIIKIRLRKKIHKQQIENLKDGEYSFISLFLSPQQKNRLNRK